MKSCRLSICQLPNSEADSQVSSRCRTNKYSAYMRQRSCQKHTSTPSTDSLALLPVTAKLGEPQLLPDDFTGRDQMFVLLKGKSFFSYFRKPSKNMPNQPQLLRPVQLLHPYLTGQKRENLKRKRLARTIEQDQLARHESERKFLRKTLKVELGISGKSNRFL